MFGQLKDLYNLKKQAEDLQKQLGNEKFTATAGSVTLTLNGSQDLLEVSVDKTQPLDADAVASDFRNAFKAAQDRMKTKLAEKFRGLV